MYKMHKGSIVEGSLHVICIEVIVGLTEADYLMGEGNVLTATVFYSRELANPITISFFPVTYDQYERVLGLTLTSDFPPRDVEANGKNFCFVACYFLASCMKIGHHIVFFFQRDGF